MITIKLLNDYVVGSDDVAQFFASTLVDSTDVSLYTTVLQRRHEMRMDLVSYDLYESLDYVDALMDMNGLVNPFAVKEGQLLVYTDAETVGTLLNNQSALDDLRAALVDASKAHRTDSARTAYLQQRAQLENAKNTLPPTVLKAGVTTATVVNGILKLTPAF